MRVVDRAMAIAVIPALAFFVSTSGSFSGFPPKSPSLGRQTLVVIFADQSLYLCPLCGERFMADYRLLASRHGQERIWVVFSPESDEESAGISPEAAAKRIRVYLRLKGCPSPVLVDRSGVFRAVGSRATSSGLVLDAAAGSVENLPAARMGITGKRP